MEENTSDSTVHIEEKKSVVLIQEVEQRKRDRREKEAHSPSPLFGMFELFSYALAALSFVALFFSGVITSFFPLWQGIYVLIFVPFFIGVGLYFQSEKSFE